MSKKLENQTVEQSLLSINILAAIIFFSFLLLILPIFCSKPFLKPYHYLIQVGTVTMLLLSMIWWRFFIPKNNFVNPPKNQLIHAFETLFLGYIVWTMASYFWATNQAEAIFSIAKMWLVGMTYFTSRYFLINTLYNFEKIICKVACIAVFASTLHTIYAFFELFQLVESSDYQYSIFLNSILYALPCILGHKAALSTYLFLLLPFNIIGLFQAQKACDNWAKLYFLAITNQFFFILLLQSRGIILALFITIFILLIVYFFAPKKSQFTLLLPSFFTPKKRLILALVVVLVIVVGMFSEIDTRLNPFNWLGTKTVNERFQLWSKTWQIMTQNSQNFLFGVGAGNWETYFPSVGLGDMRRVSYYEKVLKHPHSSLFLVVSETGFIGLSAYLLLFLIPIWAGLRFIFENKKIDIVKENNSLKAIIISAFLLGYLIENIINTPNTRLILWLLFIFLISFLFHHILPKNDIQTIENEFELKRKNLFKYKSKKIITFILLNILLITCLSMTYHRFNGQKKSHNIRKLVRQKEWKEVKRVSYKAHSIFYTTDSRTYPLQSYTALAYHKMGNPTLAQFNYEQGLKQQPYHYPTLIGLGDVYFGQKNYRKAREYYHKAAKIYPQNVKNNCQLADLNTELGRYHKARYWLEQISGSNKWKKALLRKIKTASKKRGKN